MENASWSSGGWHTKTRWQSSPIDVDAGAQSYHDQWGAQGPRMKWKEVSHTVEQLGFLAKDKKSTWVRSCKESSKKKAIDYLEN